MTSPPPAQRPESTPRDAAGAMRWASAHSVQPEASAAAEETVQALAVALGRSRVDLVMVFIGVAHRAQASAIAEIIRRELSPGCLVGTSARGVIEGTTELESGPALAAIGALLPGVEVAPFVLANDLWTRAEEDLEEFHHLAPGVPGAELVLLLADPFSLNVERVVGVLGRYAPRTRVVGGMASAGARPGSNAMILNDWVANEGGVAVALHGALHVDVVVSQGCRPIGPALEVTRAEGNVMFELDGQPALERAEQVLRGIPEADREILRHGLYVGRPVRVTASGRGDYLIRNLLGADRDRGALAVGDHMSERERIRLHVRDAATAREDLEMLLSPQVFDARARAALLFLCNGRGRALYGRSDGDVAILQSALGGGVPVAGMFCAGEIGPLGRRSYVHGHTASVAIVRPGGGSIG